MTAAVIILPVVAKPAFHDPAWREQYERECRARCEELFGPPPRTRPLLVVSNQRFRQVRGKMVAIGALPSEHAMFMHRTLQRAAAEDRHDNFDFVLGEVSAALNADEK